MDFQAISMEIVPLVWILQTSGSICLQLIYNSASNLISKSKFKITLKYDELWNGINQEN